MHFIYYTVLENLKITFILLILVWKCSEKKAWVDILHLFKGCWTHHIKKPGHLYFLENYTNTVVNSSKISDNSTIFFKKETGLEIHVGASELIIYFAELQTMILIFLLCADVMHRRLLPWSHTFLWVHALGKKITLFLVSARVDVIYILYM